MNQCLIICGRMRLSWRWGRGFSICRQYSVAPYPKNYDFCLSQYKNQEMSNKLINTINHCTVDYITPNKTIETVSFKNTDKLLYIYNYQGTHFRVFTELLLLIRFFQYGEEPKYAFASDEELDEFISSYRLS